MHNRLAAGSNPAGPIFDPLGSPAKSTYIVAFFVFDYSSMKTSIDPIIIALASIIATALVSMLSVFTPVLLDWLRSRREKNDERLEQIKTTTLNLLKDLALFATHNTMISKFQANDIR